MLAVSSLLCSCMSHGPMEEEEFQRDGRGLFITNEGNFTYGNASLSYYSIDKKQVENEIFIRANGINLGDVAQSMAIRGNKGYVVVNNSGTVFVIDVNTFKVLGQIKPLVSPRYIHFVNDYKAYITDLYSPNIAVVDPQTYQVTGYIDTDGHASTEQMVQYDRYVFTNCWSYDDKILVIDTETDLLVDSISVGIQPTSIVLDKNNKLWVATDGGYKGSPYGYTAPELIRIDAETRAVEQRFTFELGESLSKLCLNGTADTLYVINKSIWRMDVEAERFPVRPFIEYRGTLFYGITVDPVTSEVYVADAIDYVQPGVVYRFSGEAYPVDTVRTGIIPGSFCFK